MKKLITTILTIGILSSCSSVKNSVAKNAIQNTNENNFEILNGIYKNSSSEPNMKFTSLWSVLNYEIKEYPNWEELTVKIQIDENNKELINLTLLDDEKVIATNILKGKIDKNYYLFKKQTKAKLLVFILVWGIGNTSVKIALSEQNDLIVLSKTEGVGLIVAFPGYASGGQLKEHKFEKMNE